MHEQWRLIFDGIFAVSNTGRVKRADPGPRSKPLIVLKQQESHSGYLRVCLRLGGFTKVCFVHRLVAEAFLGAIPEGHQVNHIDGDKHNNHSSNLEYVTPKENMQHAVRTGLFPGGEKHYARKDPTRAPRGSVLGIGHLVEEDIIEIRRMYATGARVKDIAMAFRVTPATISKIHKRQTWRHVP